MAESERYLPILIDKVEKICDLVGITINKNAVSGDSEYFS